MPKMSRSGMQIVYFLICSVCLSSTDAPQPLRQNTKLDNPGYEPV